MDEDLDLPEIEVEIRPHPKSRRLKLSYRRGRGFLLTHPLRASKRTIRSFLKQQQEWMVNIAREQLSEIQAPPSLRAYLLENPILSLDARTTTVRFIPTQGLMKWKPSEAALEIFPVITDTQLARQLQSLAKAPLTGMLKRLAHQHDLEVGIISIRNQKTRWGSCSGNRNISLNWRLILMPHTLQEHIILHELAHLIHPNHSSAFWNCLASWDPNIEQHRRAIKKMGSRWIQLGR